MRVSLTTQYLTHLFNVSFIYVSLRDSFSGLRCGSLMLKQSAKKGTNDL